MPRLRNPLTGSVLNVDEATAERYLAQGYDSIDDKPAEKKAPAKRATAPKTDK